MENRILALIVILAAAAAAPSIAAGSALEDPVASDYLAEAKALCEADAASLWGTSLCGPTMIVAGDRRVIANIADPDGTLRPTGPVFIGMLPADVGIANTAVRWEGINWTMLRWPLPLDPIDRAILMMHEAWHRVQPQLGLSTSERVQQHLTTLEGRLAMRLELRALRKAVSLDGAASRAALSDALVFRSWRNAKFSGSRVSEAALEANEGLAEYTGWKISGALGDRGRLARHLDKGEQAPALARNFAYYTGPAYGALLDRYSQGWRLKARAQVALPLDSLKHVKTRGAGTFQRAATHYGYDRLLAEERRAERTQQRVEARWRALLIDGPTLSIPMQNANIVFDPNSVNPLPQGNVYPTLQARGSWGSIEIDGGALISLDWSALAVSAKDIKVGSPIVSAAGWRLTLKPGWSVVAQSGGWRLVQSAESATQIPKQQNGKQ